MDRIELKPCKFCGSRAAIKTERLYIGLNQFSITCTNGACGIRTKWCLYIDEAVKIWNGETKDEENSDPNRTS